jgi:hypothetical protein
MDVPRKTQWWLIAVAALLVISFLFCAVGPEFGTGLIVVSIVAFAGYRLYRARHPKIEKLPSVYCLRCGETLSFTARHCNACGSASWSFRD